VKQFNELIGVENSVPGELRRILYNKDLETELRRRFEADPPDLVYERASLYSTAGISVARALHRPLFVEVNAPLAVEQTAYRATGFGQLAAQAERWTLTHADAVLVVSAALRDHAVSAGVDPGRIHVIPNGVNPSHFHPGPRDTAFRARWNIDGALSVIGFVGGLRPWHGVESLPALLEALAKYDPAIRLVIVGEGPLRSQLQDDFDKKGLGSQVIFTGHIPHEQVPATIRHFDVAVAPYPQAEHAFYFSPLKLFEYMASGVPVVAAGLGQINELLRHGVTAMVYPPGDLDALAKACRTLLADAALRAKLGQAAAALAREQFTWDHNAVRITNLAQKFVK
jgi:glycosyltransferase involved in cell wall biosynthesis